jgi:hypothetical protein
MKNILKAAAIMAAVMCGTWLMPGASLAQNTTPSSVDPKASEPSSPAQPAPNAQSQQPQTAGQAPTGQATNSAGPTRIAPGSVIPVELTKTIDAKKAKTGDEVVAKVTQDMKASSGEVIVAKDTKMVGHVTQAQAHTKEQKESEVGIAFDHAVTKSGEMKMPMSIQAIIAPQQNNPSGDSGGESTPATGGGTATSSMGNRTSPNPSGPPQPAPTAGTDVPSGGAARPPITASTQGVIGMTDLKLEEGAQNGPQGSVVSSKKNNVKLESGTMLLLRVN